jgi:hypothetical protein
MPTLFMAVWIHLPYIHFASGQTGNLIANNIVWQAANKMVYIPTSTGPHSGTTCGRCRRQLAQGPGDKIGDPGSLVASPGYNPLIIVLA